jgi:pyruvate dehydrogenase E2 component (dihydrolipoamide acetyltransferase)
MSKHFQVNFPEIGEGVAEGEIIEWLKKEGDMLKQDEPVVIVMTDKATVELPSPYPGKLIKQHFKPGQIAYRDKPLYEIELLEDQKGIESQTSTNEAANKIEARPTTMHKEPATVTRKEGRSGKALATPKVRHMAKELGIDLETISGSGKEGRITAADIGVQQKALSPESTPVLRFRMMKLYPSLESRK